MNATEIDEIIAKFSHVYRYGDNRVYVARPRRSAAG